MDDKAFDCRHIWHPYSVPPSSAIKSRAVHAVARAEGVHLILDDGSRLIDAMSSWWSVVHGYNHPYINDALKQQIDGMSHVMFGGLTHTPAVELTRKLLHITPSNMTSVFYSDSGSVAVEVALKMALQYQHALGRTQKKSFLSVRSGYYGDTWNAMSVCDPDTGMHHIFNGALKPQYFVPQPPIAFGQQWPEDDAQNGLQAVRDVLQNEAGNIAAMIVEPVVQGAGGMYFYHPEYLNQVHALCAEHDVLLIFDEIATGFGRTGKLFASEYCTIEPDIMCLGKAMTGGYLSFAATLSSAKVAESIASNSPRAFMHGPTFMANPLACAAANASLDLLAKGEWHRQIKQIEQQFKTELQPANKLPNVAAVRVLGAIAVIEMRHNVDVDTAHRFTQELGVWLRPFGKHIYSMPPYVISPSELSKITQAMLYLAQTL